ncbi:MAG TPA: hypothetical protein VGM51_14510 [Armatimonadota bacterium]|jgi:hypothetical protein
MNQTCWDPATNPEISNLRHVRRLAAWNRVIALTEIIGGALGLVLVALSRIETVGIFIMLMTLVFGSAVYGGCLLWMGSRRGIALSFVVQGLQVFQFGAPLLAYHILIGPFARIIASMTGANLRLGVAGGFRSDFFIWIGDRVAEQTPPFFGPAGATLIGINLLALGASAILLWQLAGPPTRA